MRPHIWGQMLRDLALKRVRVQPPALVAHVRASRDLRHASQIQSCAGTTTETRRDFGHDINYTIYYQKVASNDMRETPKIWWAHEALKRVSCSDIREQVQHIFFRHSS
jgi:hypothetical protein